MFSGKRNDSLDCLPGLRNFMIRAFERLFFTIFGMVCCALWDNEFQTRIFDKQNLNNLIV